MTVTPRPPAKARKLKSAACEKCGKVRATDFQPIYDAIAAHEMVHHQKPSQIVDGENYEILRKMIREEVREAARELLKMRRKTDPSI